MEIIIDTTDIGLFLDEWQQQLKLKQITVLQKFDYH